MQTAAGRFRSLAGLLAPALVVGLTFGTTSVAQTPGAFVRTGDMLTTRSFHTATLLASGKVLVTGGVSLAGFARQATLGSTELYDPDSGTFSSSGSMTTGRRFHTATLLADGRVLIAGGYDSLGAVASAELYDPSTDTFTATGSMITARGGHSAILLGNGTVLIVGGYGDRGYPNAARAEIYDPATGLFTVTGPYVGRAGCDFCAPATLLPDGNVLFAGQYPAQLYDPLTGSFSVTGTMVWDHSTAAVLTDGKVLFTGGEDFGRSPRAELYDPESGTFAVTGEMACPRVWHTLTVLPDGTVLAAGGETDNCSNGFCVFAGSVASAELYDPSTGAFVATGDMTAAREGHTATPLSDGTVLIAGGLAYGGIGVFFGSTATAERYIPAAQSPGLGRFARSGDGTRRRQ